MGGDLRPEGGPLSSGLPGMHGRALSLLRRRCAVLRTDLRPPARGARRTRHRLPTGSGPALLRPVHLPRESNDPSNVRSDEVGIRRRRPDHVEPVHSPRQGHPALAPLLQLRPDVLGTLDRRTDRDPARHAGASCEPRGRCAREDSNDGAGSSRAGRRPFRSVRASNSAGSGLNAFARSNFGSMVIRRGYSDYPSHVRTPTGAARFQSAGPS